MDNLNLTNSRRPYRISFITISSFLSLFGAGLVYVFVHGTIKIGETPSIIVLFSTLILWNIISVYLAKRFWPASKDKTQLVKGDRKTVRLYRNLIYATFLIIFSGILVVALASEGIVLENESLALILFYGGLVGLLGIFFYYSGARGISANETIIYPFQFLNTNEKKIAVEKRIHNLKFSIFLIPIMLVIFNSVFNLLDWFAVVKILVIVFGGAFYQIKQLRNII